MLKTWFNTLIRFYVLVLWVQQIYSQHTPSCSILKDEFKSLDQELIKNTNTSNQTSYCIVVKEQDECLSYYNFLSLDMNISDVMEYKWRDEKYSYVNVTVDYNWGQQSNRFLIEENVIRTCWNVKVFGDQNPSHIFVSHIPISLNFKGLIAATVFSEENYHHSCVTSKRSCKILNESSLYFTPHSNEKSVKLKIHVEEDSEYKIDLLSGKCNISCEGITNNCTISIQSEIINFISKKNQQYGFYNLTPAFYCARIGSADGCCVIHTETIWLNVPTDFSVVIIKDPKSSYAITAVILVLILTVLILLYMMTRSILPGIMRKLKTPLKNPKEITPLFPGYDFNPLLTEMRENLQIYLVYANESKEFLELMRSFYQLLSRNVHKVWDPFSDDDYASVSENIPKWIQNILMNQKIKVVIVESEGAIMRERMWLEGHDKEEEIHYLQNTFLYTLSLIHHDINLSFDYSRVFVVRLNSSLRNKINIMVHTRYHMPDDFGRLIYDLSSSLSQIRNFQDFQEYSSYNLWSNEKEEIIRAQNLYNLSNA